MKRLLVLATVVTLCMVGSGLLLAQGNPFVGTWKLNLAKSKFGNAQAPKSETRTYEAQADGVKESIKGVGGNGSRIAYSFTASFDGKDAAISGVGTVNGADTIAVRHVDANTNTFTEKKGDKVVLTGTGMVSNGGKVLTLTTEGTNQQVPADKHHDGLGQAVASLLAGVEGP
jgi:hypothetical protein